MSAAGPPALDNEGTRPRGSGAQRRSGGTGQPETDDNRAGSSSIRSVPKSSKPIAKTRAGRAKAAVADLISPATAASGKAPPADRPASRGLQDQLARLGLVRDQDLVLHLPLRYEDHTRLVPLAELQAGAEQQAEGTVVRTDIQYRPRRQLVCLLEDEDAQRGSRAQLVLRFFHFYPSQQKALAPGRRARVFGEVRDGHFGLEIVHPQFKVVEPDAPLPDRLTPVYPTTAGLGQETLRKVIARALAVQPRAGRGIAARLGRRARTPVEVLRGSGISPRATAAPVATDAAGARLAHASGVDAPQVRRARRPAALAQGAPEGACGAPRAGIDRHGHPHRRAARARAVQAYPRAGARLAGDRRRPQANDADAAAAAGRRGQRQDDHRRARRAAGDRVRAAGRVHGADRNSRRAALPEAGVVAFRLARGNRVAHRRAAGQGAQEGACGDGKRRRDARDRHARAVRGRGPAAASRSRDRRRAASLRRRAAARAPRQGDGRIAPADDERHADPAHARDDVLRGSRRLGDRRDAAGPHAGRHPAREQPASRRGDRARAPRVRRRSPGVLGVSADRGVREARAADGGRAACRAHGRVAGIRRRSPARADEARRQGRRDGRVRGRARSTS